MSKKVKSTLGEITLSIFDGKHGDCKDHPHSGCYFISVKDLQEYGIDYSQAREIDPVDFQQNYTRTNLENGDTLYANTGDTIGKSLYIKNNPFAKRTSFQKSVAVLKPNTEHVEPRYLYYLLKYETPRLRKAATGSGQKNLLLSTMRNFEVSIHDRFTQRKIVETLSCIDDRIQCNYEVNDNLQQMAHMTFMHCFWGKPTNGTIGEILIEHEKSPIQVGQAKNTVGSYPFFTSGDTVLRWKSSLIDGRNIFMNTGGNAGVKFYVGKAAYSTDTWCVSARDGLSDYLYLFLDSIKPELSQKFFQGTGLKHLQKPILKNRPMYIPSKDELEVFNHSVIPWLTLVSDNIRESERLAALRDWLLPMLMNGQATIED